MATTEENVTTVNSLSEMPQYITAQDQIQAQFDMLLKQEEMAAKNRKLDTLRLAQATLMENSRAKPVSERDVSAEDVISFAETLYTYVNT